MLRRNFQMRQETHRGRRTHQRRRIYRSSYHSGTYYNESDAELIVTFLDAAISPYQKMVTDTSFLRLCSRLRVRLFRSRLKINCEENNTLDRGFAS